MGGENRRSKMADDDPWKLCEDGYLNTDTESKSIIYHPNLNIILVSTKSSEVHVIDVNSGVILQKSSLSAKQEGTLNGLYISGHDKILFTDGKGIGVRRDYNGVLFLDTILQTPVSKPEDVVKLELLLSEAILLQHSLRCVELPGVDHMSEVLQELGKKIKEGQSKPKKGTKAQKWNSICLELPHCALKLVCAGMVQELKRQNRHIPALSIASAINERLNCLLPTYSSEGVPADRALMFSEAARRDTFIKWPHMNYKWALPDQMAQAGFYHQPNSTGDDRAMCFTCNVCLVCWEPTDEPWSEHERHSPSCPFVKGEYTQNVPLSVTYATAPATLFGEQGEEVASIGTSSVPELFATATQHGLVAIWNTSRQLKKEVCFYITPSDPVIMRTQHQDSIGYSDIRVREAWPEKSDDAFASEVSTSDVVEIPLSDIAVENLLGPPLGCQDMELTALCIVGGPHQQKSQRHIRKKVTKPTQSGSVVSVRPSLVGGISISPLAVSSRRTNLDLVWGGNSDIISSPMVRAMNDVNEASNRESAALDIMKVREVDSGANSDLMSTNQHMTAERKKSLFLVVYDFHYHNHVKDECADTKDEGGGKGNPGQAGNSAKKVVLGTGTSASSSGTRQENNNMYQEIFLSKFLYDVPVIEDVDTDIVMAPPPECLVDGLEFPAASSSGSIYPPPTAIAAPASGGGTYDTSSVNVTFSAINGGLNMSNFPSTSDGSPPMVIKVSRVSKKDSCSSNKTSLDSMSSCQLTKRRDPFMVQCIALPDVYKEKRNLSIIGIHPTKDGGHLLVVLGSIDCDNSSSVPGYGNVTSVPVSSNFQGNMMFECSDNDSDMDVDMEDVVGLSSKSTESKQVEHFASTQNFGFFHDGDAFEEGLQMLESSNCKRTNVPLCKGSVLLVYALNFEGEVVKLDETPVKVRDFGTCGECPLEVTLLPLLEREDNGDASNNQPNPVKGCPQGMAVLVCRDGFVRIIDLATLKTVSQAVPEKKGTRFVSATYCNSLERLCACTDKGSLHFFMLNEDDNVDEREEECLSHRSDLCLSYQQTPAALSSSEVTDFTSDSFGAPSSSILCPAGSANSSSDQLLVNKSALGLLDLQLLHGLTEFENLSPCYSATVPPCWSEMMQAQKQRRHPQHLQQGDELQHTRSWRLQNDATTWDEHVFEITLPRSCCIGHVDLKFSLHAPCASPPLIQITLLKQNASGIGRKEKMFTPPVDETIDFNINMQFDGSTKGPVENPVTSEEYLRDHNTEILCGPVNLSSCLDLSEQGGTVTLTSPKLFRIRGRTLLVHIKALGDDKEVLKEMTSKSRISEEKGSASKKSKLDSGKGKLVDPVLDYYLHAPGNTVDRLASAAASKKMEYYLGCDWLHEISITIRRTKQTNIPNERNQRCAMLESNAFVEKLVRVVCLDGPDKTVVSQSMALDILIWVASIRLSRHRTTKGDTKSQQLELARIIENNLIPLIKHCILMSGRSIAHKCVKLIIICSEGMKNVLDSVTVQFDGCVLRALLEWLPMISCSISAGALGWYFLLLSRVMTLDVSATIGQKCVTLLQQIAHEMSARSSPYHLLLRTRFGLYSTPFEPELFDIEPPVPAKFSSVPITYATVVSGETGGGALVTGPGISAGTSGFGLTSDLDLRELLGVGGGSSFGDKGTPNRFKGLSSNHYMKGLLEAEPLHFTCHAASDGTKMEKIEPGSTSGANGSVPVGNFFDPNNFITTNSGSKKPDTEFISFYEDMKKEDYFQIMSNSDVKLKCQSLYSVENKNKSKVKAPVVVNLYSQGSSSGGGGGVADAETSSSSSSQQSTVSGPPPARFASSGIGLAKENASCEVDNRKQETKKGDDMGSLLLPWQQLLMMPPQHMLVIERMHSGARRFVVLDFGSPILLTDLMIPACSDLVSLSIDIWCQGEETDGRRLVVASDIGTKSLVMSDLQPPPICRYLKITTIGRYGMSTTRCKIPVGSFYGHIVILPGECYSEKSEVQGLSETNIQAQLTVLSALFEDIHCRYSLACAKLHEFLTPLLTSEIPNVVHMHHYLQKGRDIEKYYPSPEGQKILSAYQECVTFQHQLNLVRNVMRRLESAQGKVHSLPDLTDTQRMLSEACTDKLRVLGEGLLDILLYLVYEIGPVPRLPASLYQTFDQNVCEHLFHCLCVKEDTHIQLSACTLLVRMCGLQPWWGDFLANTLTRLYSSQNTSIFPQDRVFILLTYLGRKSLAGGATRCSVLDSVLGTLTRLLSPLTSHESGFLRAEMDLSLIGWILLFLSVCLDVSGTPCSTEEMADKSKDKDQGVTSRWDFIQGEVAMQRRMATTSRCNASRSYRRKLQKRLMHHKQQLEDLEAAKKAFHASTQALSALSSQAANLSSKLEAALKQQEQFFRKTLKQHSAKHFKDILQIRRNDGPTLLNKHGLPIPRTSNTSVREREESETERDMNLCLPQSHCLPVTKGLIALILQMDFTCNIDMFLLACKVVARIVVSTRPAITLGELMTQDQLLHLVRLAVWNDQHKASWGGPWASHAICCLLQDILEGVRMYPNLGSQEGSPAEDILDSAITTTMTESEEPVAEPSTTSNSQEGEEDFTIDDSTDASVPGPSCSKSNGFQLPSLLESDDSELEDFLDDILERGRNILKKGAASRAPVSATSSISTALDARLEYGVEGSAEVMLRRLTAQGAYNLPLSVNSAIQAPPDAARQPSSSAWDENTLALWQPTDCSPSDSLQMLTTCFDKVFTELHQQNSWTNLELVLQLWLTLNLESACDPGVLGTFDPGVSPCIYISPNAVSGVMAALAWHPGISLRAWCLAFQSLTMLANTPFAEAGSPEAAASWAPETVEEIENSLRGMAKIIVGDPQFVPMLLRFLSGSGLNTGTYSAKGCAGPSVCQALHDLLVRLQMRCDVVTTTSKYGNSLKELLLKLVYQLVQPSGALANQQGPLDAQCKLVELLLNLNFANIDLSTAMSILESVGVLVYTYILSLEKVKCRSVSESNVTASSCFGGLFASVLGGETKQGKPASWDALLCSLLKLVNKLVQTPLVSQSHTVRQTESMETLENQPGHQAAGNSQSDNSDMCQTDEHKAAEQQNSTDMARQLQNTKQEVRVPCVADTVLQHHPTMLRLLSALAGCSGSTLAMLLGSAAPPEQLILGEFGEPLSVGDAVFQLLAMLARKATSPQLILRPLFDFLSSACNTQPPVGAVGVMQLSEPLLWFILRVLDKESALEEFNRMGGVRVICENLVKSNQALINAHPSLVSIVMQHFSHVPPSNSLNNKKMPNPIETYEGLMNFAPLGTISSSNPTAQPADVLIQSAPPHRRARTPAWSYHFYPDETWVDLTLTLPCAVLLKEVQLQPHLTSLATCPSAVAVEVSRDSSSGLVPVCPPLSTSGLTFVRLSLPQPEIVTSVLVRLYKPRDSSNIGLSQIRLLGSTTFGETAFRTVNMDVPDEEQLTKSSLGWLRLLHHCLSLPNQDSELATAVVTSTANVPGLLEACCGLLLIPAPSPSLFTPNLERVLLKLGLHRCELGLKQINTLLRNGAAAFLQGSLPVGQSSTSTSAVVDSVVELLYQLCTTQDDYTKDRVNALLTWLHETASAAIENKRQSHDHSGEIWSPSSAYVHSAAAILWAGHESGVNYDLPGMVTPELFSILYNWTLILPAHSALKKAIDTLLCSMCYIKPALFPTLLQRMGVLVPNLSTHHSASISDDRKDHELDELYASISDDSKELVIGSEQSSDSGEWYNHLMIQDIHRLKLSECQLMTVAMACQSPPAIHQLLDSGLPTLLTHGILEFCNREQYVGQNNHKCTDKGQNSSGKRQSHQSRMTDADKASGREGRNHRLTNQQDGLPMLRVDTMAMVLNFFAEVCAEGHMRDWLGSPEGSVFWLPLLSLLCNKSNSCSSVEGQSRCELISESFSALESATVKFLSRCCWCHPTNHQLLSRVLCDVISQQKTIHQNVTFLHGISGFTRRLVLQLLLENEKLFVFVKANFPLQRSSLAITSYAPYQPRYGVGHQHQLLYLSTQTTCADVLKYVSASGNLLPLLGDTKVSENATNIGANKESRKELWEIGLGLVDQLSVAAGVTAKDKRVKDAKNAAAAGNRSSFPKKSRASGLTDSTSPTSPFVSGLSVPQQTLQHPTCPGIALPGQMTLSQLLTLAKEQGESLSTPCITLTLTQHAKSASSKEAKEGTAKVETEQLLSYPGLPTPLQVFTQQGGLALLAQHLPLVYPETLRYSTPDKVSTPDALDAEWVKVDASDDIYEVNDLEDSLPAGSSSPGAGGNRPNSLPPPSVPPHSLAAFGLFLRLPGYAEVLLRDKKKAQCLLRLVLGVTDDGEGGDIFSSPVAGSLHTLPFQVLRQLFDSTPLTTDDGVLLRRTTIDIGAVHLLLGCLSVFTHQTQDINLPGVQHELVIAATKATAVCQDSRGKSDDKSHLYWAKGTGFGTGSTAQSWNVEQALLRQRSEEEHVTVLLQVLSSYINPGGTIPTNFFNEEDEDESESESGSEQPQLPMLFHDLLQQSCLLPAVSSYLRNDSVLDMARHIPLYRAVLQLLRAMALSPQLVSLLLPQDRRQSSSRGDELSVVCLLTKMKNCVDTYASRLKINKSKGNGKARLPSKYQDELEQDEGLALLIPDIQETANLVQVPAPYFLVGDFNASHHSWGSDSDDDRGNKIAEVATDRLVLEDEIEAPTGKDSSVSTNLEFPLQRSLEERYLEVMKQLQFDTYEMITECSEGGYQFVVSYHFESNMRAAGERSHPSRVKRLAQETVTLSTSLPLSYSSSVFVRCDTDRLDIMKVLITGPAETPYANGCFEFDVYFPPDYPNSPMLINLETTGHHTIRFNPNLYNDGKVCLSVLNTWHGRPEEKWNAQTSSFLQVLVSIQSLILVPEPYFNEPGYERSRGTPSGNQSSREYNSNICQATVKWAMLEQVRNPCPCFRDVIHTHFWMKRQEIVNQIEGWISDMETQCGDRRTGRAISLNAMALKRHFRQLREELSKLKTPEGLEDLADCTFQLTSPSSVQCAQDSKETLPLVGSSSQAFSSGLGSNEKHPVEENVNHDIDTDVEMEKMVSKVCE
ncbi:baculoviral IAP repeat-containing protein 6 isoform X2 [Periplaneta americana]|uniref:baculoviral IAP repeat-containing protein 6 isoform X2 n=1 Tax=Periplaneta americana TaxID=6978 RepID=UPI0037E77E6C